jgi:hypothetical protein
MLDLTILPGEIERLIPGAIQDIQDEMRPDPLEGHRMFRAEKKEEYLARERRRFERKVKRLNELLAAWLELKMERLA